MTFPKLFALVSVVLFGLIGGIALFKERKIETTKVSDLMSPIEIEIEPSVSQTVTTSSPFIASNDSVQRSSTPPTFETHLTQQQLAEPLPEANRIEEFFNTYDPKFPIVETLTYTSIVPWLKGRPAWLSDYASHYNTSRHFIARSVNGKPDYFTQNLVKGDRFNVFTNKNFEFHLLIDLSRCRLWFYYIDLEAKKKTLIKTYRVGLGRPDSSKGSGLLTPIGKYILGNRIMAYKPKMMGIYQGKKTEMVTVFGTRWIPFEKEVGACTAPAKGFGIHGTPWHIDPQGSLSDNCASLGKYESDGCIRLASADIEEIYAIVVTKPTTIELVKDFHDSILSSITE